MVRGAASQDKTDLKLRLVDLWKARRFAEFYAVVSEELKPVVMADLCASHSCTHEEAEDCFHGALEGLIARQDRRCDEIGDPQNYVWRSAENAAFTMKKKQAGESKAIANRSADGEGPGAISNSSALVLMDEVVEEIEAEENWAGPVVREAVSMLPPSLQRVVRHELATRVGYDSKHGAEDLGMARSTYRVYRSRAHKELRRLIPAVMQEHGLDPRHLAEPESVLEEPSTFMSDDESEALGSGSSLLM